MTKWLSIAKKWSLGAVASATFLGGMFALTSCGGEGGPVGGPPGGGGTDDAITRQFLALLPAGQQGAQYVGANQCGSCHNSEATPGHEGNIYSGWQQTAHANAKVGCESCHGPGGNHVSNPSKENILTFPRSTSPVVCGQCHGSLHKEYMSSAHSKIVDSPVHDLSVNPQTYGRASRCGACHSGLARIETYEKGIDMGTLPDEKFVELSEQTMFEVPHSASCATCHNPHKRTGYLNDEGKEVQLRHPVTNTDPTPVGPGQPAGVVTTFNHICAQCHNGRGVDPSDARLNAGTARPSMHDSNQYNMLMGFGGVDGGGPVSRLTAHSTMEGQCSKCHMPNSRHTFTVSFDAGCQPCHTAADAAARTSSAKNQVTTGLYALKSRLQAWAQNRFGDPALWDYTTVITGVGKTPPNQADVPIEVKRARHNYYFIVRDASMGPHNLKYALHLLNVANENLNALSVPRAPEGKVSLEEMKRSILEDRQRSRAASHE